MGTKPKDNRFNGSAIYQPDGAAGEYAKWACNLFNGCSNRCDYCYNRHSMTAKVLGADEVTMKKQLTNVKKGHLTISPSFVVFHEIDKNREAIIRDGGLFLSFVSDPLLPETCRSTLSVLIYCGMMDSFRPKPIPVTILTKCAWWIEEFRYSDEVLARGVRDTLIEHKDHLSLGFTLTGMDDMERHCISNTQQRIDAMVWAKQNGIHTWASIEPVIDFDRAFEVIYKSFPYCDEYRIGLASKLGIKYELKEVVNFVNSVRIMNWNEQKKIIWKQSVLKLIKEK